MKSKTARLMNEWGEGVFSAIDGTVYGFWIRDGRCIVFDTVESDDFREESFKDAEAALDGFKVNGKPLSSFSSLTVEPLLIV